MEKLKFFKTRNVQSPERGTELSAGVDMYIPVDLSLNELSAIQPIKGQVEVKVNPTLTVGAASNIVKYVTNMKNIEWNFKETVLLPLEKVLRDKLAEGTDTISIGDELIE